MKIEGESIDSEQRVFSVHIYNESRIEVQHLLPHATSPVVDAISKYCSVVNWIAAERMKILGWKAEYLEHEEDRCTVAHAFIRVQTAVTYILYDYQYLQFVPPEWRHGLPDCMEVPYRSRQDVRTGLQRFHIPDYLHTYWLEELFNTP